jgi:transcriptional regulator with XRE-family HTH domain
MRRVKKTPFPKSHWIDHGRILGAAIRASRTEAGISLVEAALALDIPKQTLADIEAGKPSVRFGTYLSVAQAFGLSLFVAQRYKKDSVVQFLADLAKDSDD